MRFVPDANSAAANVPGNRKSRLIATCTVNCLETWLIHDGLLRYDEESAAAALCTSASVVIPL
jgi:hypothetical protein